MTKKRKRAPRQHVAKITIWDASGMTAHGRRSIAFWLRRHATALLEDGAQYAKCFTGRYMAR